MVRASTYGKGIEMTTSCRATLSWSSSYSILTSQVPSLEGVGQQLTTKPTFQPMYVDEIEIQLTGKRNVAFVLS